MPTVRHTGSLFMVDILRDFKRVTLRGEDCDNALIFDHVYDLHMRHFHRWAQKYPTVVIPLRDPTECAHSWSKRGEDFEWFFKMWDNLLEFQQYRPFYIPVDHPDRDAYLQDLSDHIGTELKTDWTPKNHVKKPSLGIPDVSSLYDNPIIKAVYGS